MESSERLKKKFVDSLDSSVEEKKAWLQFLQQNCITLKMNISPLNSMH